MVSGRASACPMAWPRSFLANRVKSGMLSETVDQKPTVPLSAGIRNFSRSLVDVNFEGAASIGPKPPALLMAQNAMKQMNVPYGLLPHAGQTVLSRMLMASPPIQLWMPNHPQATMARNTAATLAPSTPNDARARTGKGTP